MARYVMSHGFFQYKSPCARAAVHPPPPFPKARRNTTASIWASACPDWPKGVCVHCGQATRFVGPHWQYAPAVLHCRDRTEVSHLLRHPGPYHMAVDGVSSVASVDSRACLMLTSTSLPTGANHVSVALEPGVTDYQMLEAYFHALMLHHVCFPKAQQRLTTARIAFTDVIDRSSDTARSVESHGCNCSSN
jgi:hypothetical protein